MNSPVNIKTAEVLEGDDLGDRHLPSFFVPTPGHLDSSCVPTPGNLPIFSKKMLMPGGWPGGGGMGTAGID